MRETAVWVSTPGASLNPLLSALFTSGTNAARPAAGVAGRIYQTTDNPRGLWMDTGTEWMAISPITAELTVDGAAITANTTPANIGLAVPLKANARYWVEANIIISSANATHDAKLGWSHPGATMKWGTYHGGSASQAGFGGTAIGQSPAVLHAITDTRAVGTVTGEQGISLVGRIKTTVAGDLNLQLAQNTSDAGELKPLEGSTLIATRTG